jgi:hypothetical protein
VEGVEKEETRSGVQAGESIEVVVEDSSPQSSGAGRGAGRNAGRGAAAERAGSNGGGVMAGESRSRVGGGAAGGPGLEALHLEVMSDGMCSEGPSTWRA